METLKDFCDRLRKEIEVIKKQVGAATSDPCTDQGEEKENYILAYRHLEDARMRLGKVIQANGDGVSVLDKMTPTERDEFNARKGESA